MKGVISLGEALIDFIPLDPGNTTYQKSPGGAPANVAVGLARLGAKSAFLGKVGNDVLGSFLRRTMEENQVDVRHMTFTDDARTGVVFVTLDPTGERHFSFYIDPSADRYLEEDDIVETLFAENKILHFGSISLIGEPSASATRKAVKAAKAAGMLISYDPNLRLGLWESEELAKQTILSMLPAADVLKISDEELTFLTGETDIEAGLDELERYNIPLIFVTMGGAGSIYRFHRESGKVPAMKVETVDTTGAGDAFVSAILYCLNDTDKRLDQMTVQDIQEMVRFASVSGGLAASKKGAMTALPTLEEVKRILEKEGAN
ncbi:aminoimidazole riboside kinase [Effusibacillus consociatus]|uniref:Aminoimidazole riboside kinase n=1 Tax=Effusibacillus consociatus TaxID=1117041 RepID=A0ABV9Q152_9BACL